MDLRTGDVYWPLVTGTMARYPPLTSDLRADVAVIGAGITGALAAHRLTECGASVVVVDKRNAAAGSTAASSGLLMYETDTELKSLGTAIGTQAAARVWRLGQEAVNRVEQLCADAEDKCGFSRRDALYAAATWWTARSLAAEFDERRRRGFDVEWLSAGDLDTRYGIHRRAAILSRGDAQLNPYAFTHWILRKAIALGAQVFGDTELSSVDTEHDAVTVRTRDGSCIRAGHLVWATGYEGVEETQRKVGRLYSTWVALSEPAAAPSQWNGGVLLWETSRPYLYLRTTNDGRVMAGGLDERFSQRHANHTRLQRKTTTLSRKVGELVPSLHLRPAYQWAGTFLTTRDGLPYIGTVPEHPRAWLALGYGGNGITFSTIAANLIADAWQGKKSTDAPLFAFDR